MADEPSEDVQAVLAAMEEAEMPEISDLEPAAAREMMGEAFQPDEPVVDLARVEDRTIPGPAGEIPVRVYAPAADGPQSVVVFFHGGGFVLGDLDGHDAPCRLLADATNAVVVSVDYRLAPEDPFPAAVEDAYAATEWAAANADALGADGGRLAIAGDSAGGNLAAVVALAARDRGGPDVAHQALFYPVTDFRGANYELGGAEGYDSYAENGEGYFLTLDDMRYFSDHYVDSWVQEVNPYLSPLLAASHADLPPASVVTCGFDPLRDEGRAYVDALREDGTRVEHHHFPELIHGAINLVAEPADVAGGHDAIDAVASDLRNALA